MATTPTNPGNEIGGATAGSSSSAGASPRRGLPSFSKKEQIVLLIALVVVIGGTAAAALSPARSTASASPATPQVAIATVHACPATPSVEAAAAAAQPATPAVAAITPAPVAATSAAPAATTTAVRSGTTNTKSTTAKKVSAPTVTSTSAAPSLVTVGTLVNFGSYSGQPLRWRVLDADASGVLLLSEYVVSAGAFQSDWEGRNASSYGASEVRSWLKSGFSAKAFDTTQTAALLPHSGGAVGSDRVFLLSASEVSRYLPKAANRRAAPGASAGASQIGFSGQALSLAGPYASWWLADGANDNYTAQVVGADGKLGSQLVYYSDIGVRPAIRINRDKLGFSLDVSGGN
jgi:hypothetical protein